MKRSESVLYIWQKSSTSEGGTKRNWPIYRDLRPPERVPRVSRLKTSACQFTLKGRLSLSEVLTVASSEPEL
jgi:hypothetical protein